MTSTALRKKVHQYVDSVDDSLLEVVYNLFKLYREEDDSLLTKEQKTELDKRAELYRAGKLKTFSWKEVKEKARRSK